MKSLQNIYEASTINSLKDCIKRVISANDDSAGEMILECINYGLVGVNKAKRNKIIADIKIGLE